MWLQRIPHSVAQKLRLCSTRKRCRQLCPNGFLDDFKMRNCLKCYNQTEGSMRWRVFSPVENDSLPLDPGPDTPLDKLPAFSSVDKVTANSLNSETSWDRQPSDFKCWRLYLYPQRYQKLSWNLLTHNSKAIFTLHPTWAARLPAIFLYLPINIIHGRIFWLYSCQSTPPI